MKCSVPHCSKESVARGFCANHYRASRKYGDALAVVVRQHHGKTLQERFDIYTKRSENGCWAWLSYKDPFGYGRLNVGGKPVLASRISYLLHYGDIPDGLFVLHRCDNPSCVNPGHLFLGTQADNVADMETKGRSRKRSLSGEQHHRSKVTNAIVRAIRRSPASDADMAAKYQISRATVHSIRHRKTWKHV